MEMRFYENHPLRKKKLSFMFQNLEKISNAVLKRKQNIKTNCTQVSLLSIKDVTGLARRRFSRVNNTYKYANSS